MDTNTHICVKKEESIHQNSIIFHSLIEHLVRRAVLIYFLSNFKWPEAVFYVNFLLIFVVVCILIFRVDSDYNIIMVHFHKSEFVFPLLMILKFEYSNLSKTKIALKKLIPSLQF